MAPSRAPAPFHFDLRHAPGATLLFLLGVFLTFAPVIVLSVIPGRALAPSTIALWFAISGTCGALWALGGVASRWFFIPAVALQLVVSLAIGRRWLGDASLFAVSLDPLGVAVVACIAGGYTCFVTYIMGHARRTIAISAEMALAARIHRHLVPEIVFRSGAFEIAARSEASGVMGGDVVYAAPLPDGSVEAIVADVAGHGVRAGVVMAMVRSAIESHRGRRVMGDGRALVNDLAQELNRVLAALTEPDMFVTAMIVHAAPDGIVNVLGAGHPPLLHRRGGAGGAKDDGGVAVIEVPGLPLGVVEPFEPSFATVKLEPGDSLVLYTDGLTETALPGDGGGRRRPRAQPVRRLDVPGLAPMVADAPAGSMAAVEFLLDAVDAAGGRVPAEDDRTVLIITFARR